MESLLDLGDVEQLLDDRFGGQPGGLEAAMLMRAD
jgi:hypothetical protein